MSSAALLMERMKADELKGCRLREREGRRREQGKHGKRVFSWFHGFETES